MKLNNRDINLNNYTIFYTVAKLKSFTLASNELFISQPAVSSAIKQLEDTLCVKLFYRDKGNVLLTSVGEEVLKYVEVALNNFSIIDDKIVNFRNFGIGNISIGSPAHIHNAYLFKYIDSFIKKYPNVNIRFETGNISSLIEKLEKHEIDFIVDEYPSDCKYNNIKVVKLHDFSKGFIYNKRFFSELNEKEFDLSMLENYTLILPLKENSYRKELDNLIYQNNIKCNNIIEVNNTSQMYKYIDNGVGLGYLITDLIDEPEKYNKINIKNFKIKYEMDLMYIEGYTSIMAEELIRIILEAEDND